MVTSGPCALAKSLFAAAKALASLTTWLGSTEAKQALIWLATGAAVVASTMIRR